jgi:hypothetical protein
MGGGLYTILIIKVNFSSGLFSFHPSGEILMTTLSPFRLRVLLPIPPIGDNFTFPPVNFAVNTPYWQQLYLSSRHFCCQYTLLTTTFTFRPLVLPSIHPIGDNFTFPPVNFAVNTPYWRQLYLSSRHFCCQYTLLTTTFTFRPLVLLPIPPIDYTFPFPPDIFVANTRKIAAVPLETAAFSQNIISKAPQEISPEHSGKFHQTA